MDLDVKDPKNPDTFFTERYEIISPTVSAHNLIIGQLYVDIGDRLTVRNLRTKEYALIDYTRRGWFAKEENFYKCEGTIFSEA